MNSPLYAGFAKAIVTPPLGMAMEGLAQQGGCQSIHDDLYIRSLFLSQGESKLLIITCDLLFFEYQQVDNFKAIIGEATGLSPAQILINTSHTHAGPRLTHWQYSGVPDEDYISRIGRTMALTAKEASLQQQSVTVWAGMTETDLPVSRRKPDSNGKVYWAPYPVGEVCRALPFAAFKNDAGQVVSLLFSVSCHPSMIYSLDISADFPGVATAQLNDYFETDGAMFLQGAGGDTKPRQIAGDKRWSHGSWEEVFQAGDEVAQAVIAAEKRGLARIDPSLKSTVLHTEWPLQELPTKEYLTELMADPETSDTRRLWAKDMSQQLAGGKLAEAIEVDIHAVQIGPGLRIIGFEGELVGELGNLVLDAFPSGVTFPLGYTNATRIYLPSSHMLEEDGYEVVSFWEYHHPAPLAPGMEEMIKSALNTLKSKIITE